MAIRIRSRPFPAGGFGFKDPRTNRTFDGMSADLTMQAREIIAHRMANPAIYPAHESSHFSLVDVIGEITRQVCQRSPASCYDDRNSVRSTPVPPSVRRNPATIVVQAPSSVCRACGSGEWEPVYCKVCSGKKLTGYKCKSCGKERSR